MRLFAVLFLAACSGADKVDDTGGDTETGDTDTDTVVPADDHDDDGYADDIDCDDGRADVHPGVAADICNGRDDDCDGAVDEDPDLVWFLDGDGDGFGASGSSSFVDCDPGVDAYATNEADCDDDDGATFPGADEACDGLDNDCNGGVDDDPALFATWYPDEDADGYGDAGASPVEGCLPGEAWIDNADDCDDGIAAVHPGALEICNDLDDDCNGSTDENADFYEAYYEDSDGDGAGVDRLVYGCDEAQAGGVTNTWDCDDRDANEPVFVTTSGSSRGDGSLADPYNSVQTAVIASRTCVMVGAGTYAENVDFGGNSITLQSIDGSEFTTLDGLGTNSVVTVNNGESVEIIGFTITGGTGQATSGSSSYWDGTQYVYYDYYYYYGGGAYLGWGSSARLEDVVFDANPVPQYTYTYYNATYFTYGYGYGGGVYSYGATLDMTDVTFSDNTASGGAALTNEYGTVTGTRVRMYDNDGDYGTLTSYSGSDTWNNLEISSNENSYGYASIYLQNGTFSLRNGTIVGGGGDGGGANSSYGIYAYQMSTTLDSTVIYDHYYGLYDAESGSGRWTITYSDVYGNYYDYYNVDDVTGTSGNISVDPGFTTYSADWDGSNDDLSLSGSSSLTDAGNPASAYYDADGSRNDIGAFGGPEGW
jgi:hypothetical protein